MPLQMVLLTRFGPAGRSHKGQTRLKSWKRPFSGTWYPPENFPPFLFRPFSGLREQLRQVKRGGSGFILSVSVKFLMGRSLILMSRVLRRRSPRWWVVPFSQLTPVIQKPGGFSLTVLTVLPLLILPFRRTTVIKVKIRRRVTVISLPPLLLQCLTLKTCKFRLTLILCWGRLKQTRRVKPGSLAGR